jgi:hypothetical protein
LLVERFTLLSKQIFCLDSFFGFGGTKSIAFVNKSVMYFGAISVLIFSKLATSQRAFSSCLKSFHFNLCSKEKAT